MLTATLSTSHFTGHVFPLTASTHRKASGLCTERGLRGQRPLPPLLGMQVPACSSTTHRFSHTGLCTPPPPVMSPKPETQGKDPQTDHTLRPHPPPPKPLPVPGLPFVESSMAQTALCLPPSGTSDSPKPCNKEEMQK